MEEGSAYNACVNTLYLTAAEQTRFDALPADIREGFTVEVEMPGYDDTMTKMLVRLSLMRLTDPDLLALRDRVKDLRDAEDIVKIVRTVDFQSISDDDLSELFFALGPTILGKMIEQLMPEVKTDEDVLSIASLTLLRHTLLTSFHPVS